MKQIILHPIFFTGLAIRIALIMAFAPFVVSDWFAPFMDVSTSIPTIDPWSEWISSGGSPEAFPYGLTMWMAFLPMTLVSKLIGLPLHFAYYFTILLADLLLLLALNELLPKRNRLILLVYWLSPVVILASYGLGLNDVIPALLLVLAIVFMRRINMGMAGVVLSAAISAKLSIIVALPFFIIYLLNNQTLKHKLKVFLSGFMLATFVFGMPFALSSDGLQMLFTNAELATIYQLDISLTKDISIYVVPLVYLVMIYLVWRIGRLNFDLFQATTGIAFLLIVLMTPSSPGWLVWSLPFLVLYQAMSGRVSNLIVALFSAVYVLSTILVTPFQFFNGQELLFSSLINAPMHMNHIISLVQTLMFALGLVLIIRVWRESVNRNDFFRLSRKPFVIGVAGDSGSGKDTFANAVKDLFGKCSVAKLSGDDYRLWDRQKPIWHVMTDLNPMANDLEGFSSDVLALADNKAIMSRKYNPAKGKMGKPLRINSNDFIIASGLHALYPPVLRDCYNLKIFLDMDERLRNYFKLKHELKQVSSSRGETLHLFDKTQNDSDRFIRSQINHADLTLSLQPVNSQMLDELSEMPTVRLKLAATSKTGFNEVSLRRVLVGVCGLHVDINFGDNGENAQLTVEGETTAADIAMAAEMLCPSILEFLDIEPKWQDGTLGLMQLIILFHINQALNKRFI